MDNLTQHRQSPLNSATFGNKKNIYLAEKPFATTLEIRVNLKSNTARKIEKTLKIKFPKQVGQTFRSKSFTVLTLGPDWWMVVGANRNHEAKIRAAIGNEFALLRYLIINADRVVSKAQILDHVWQYDFRGDMGIVETYISYLRKKVDAFEPPLIHTVRGVGYRLRMPPK